MCIRPAMCGRQELVSSVEIAFRDGYGVSLHRMWSLRGRGTSCDNADSASTRARIALGVGEDTFRREADDAL